MLQDSPHMMIIVIYCSFYIDPHTQLTPRRDVHLFSARAHLQLSGAAQPSSFALAPRACLGALTLSCACCTALLGRAGRDSFNTYRLYIKLFGAAHAPAALAARISSYAFFSVSLFLCEFCEECRAEVLERVSRLSRLSLSVSPHLSICHAPACRSCARFCASAFGQTRGTIARPFAEAASTPL